jgi:hypothetical protein
MEANKKNLGSDLALVDAHKITPAEYEELPELTPADLYRPDAVWKIGGKKVSPAKGRAAFSSILLPQQQSFFATQL